MPVRGVVLDSESHTCLSSVRGANGFLGSDVVAPAAAVRLSMSPSHAARRQGSLCAMATSLIWSRKGMLALAHLGGARRSHGHPSVARA